MTKSAFIIFTQLADGSIVKACTWDRNLVEGLERARREADMANIPVKQFLYESIELPRA